ncbi:MAG: tetratricopeptide repeat protein, partial [Acidobacteriota bacterium]
MRLVIFTLSLLIAIAAAPAVAQTEAAQTEPPQSSDTGELTRLERLAEDAFVEDDLAVAAALYRQLAQRHSQSNERTRNLVIVAYLELQQGRKAEAIETVRDALIENPDYRFESESYDDVMREVFYEGQKAAIAERQQLADQAVRLGNEQMRQGDQAAAGRHFETALSYRPDHVQALYNLALTHLNQRREEEAEAGFQKLLALGDAANDGLRALTMINLGYLYQKRGLDQEAIDVLEQAVAIDPSSTQGWSNLGAARRRAGDQSGAADAFRRAYELSPQNSEALGNL